MRKTYLFFILFFPLYLSSMQDDHEKPEPVYEVVFEKQSAWSEAALDRLPNKPTGRRKEVRGEVVDEKCVCGRYDLMPRPQPTAGHEKKKRLSEPVVSSLLDQAPEGLQNAIENHLSNPTGLGPLLLYFHGESGTGKTETAEVSAQNYNLPWFSTAPYDIANQWEFSEEENMRWLLGQFADITRPHVLILDCFSNYFFVDEPHRVRAVQTGLSMLGHQNNLLLIGIAGWDNAQLPVALREQFRTFEFSRYRTPAQIKQTILAHNPGYELAEDVSEEFLLDLASRMNGKSGFTFQRMVSEASLEKVSRLGRENGVNPWGLSADPEKKKLQENAREAYDALPISKQDFEAAYAAAKAKKSALIRSKNAWTSLCTIQ